MASDHLVATCVMIFGMLVATGVTQSQTPVDRTAIEGDHVELRCDTAYDRTKDFYWSEAVIGIILYRPAGADVNNVTIPISRFRGRVSLVGLDSVNLRIDNVTMADEGSYNCQQKHADQQGTLQRLRVLEAVPPDPAAPTVTGYSGGFLTPGSNVTLTCVSMGARPPANLTWWTGDTQLKASNSSTPDSTWQGDTRSEVTIADLKLSDNGRVYQCRASHRALAQVETSQVTAMTFFLHLGLSCAMLVTVLQFRPMAARSSNTVLLHVVFGLPLFLFPSGLLQLRATLVILLSGILNPARRLSDGVIAGIAIGSVLGLFVVIGITATIAILSYKYYKRKQERRSSRDSTEMRERRTGGATSSDQHDGSHVRMPWESEALLPTSSPPEAQFTVTGNAEIRSNGDANSTERDNMGRERERRSGGDSLEMRNRRTGGATSSDQHDGSHVRMPWESEALLPTSSPPEAQFTVTASYFIVSGNAEIRSNGDANSTERDNMGRERERRSGGTGDSTEMGNMWRGGAPSSDQQDGSLRVNLLQSANSAVSLSECLEEKLVLVTHSLSQVSAHVTTTVVREPPEESESSAARSEAQATETGNAEIRSNGDANSTEMGNMWREGAPVPVQHVESAGVDPPSPRVQPPPPGVQPPEESEGLLPTPSPAEPTETGLSTQDGACGGSPPQDENSAHAQVTNTDRPGSNTQPLVTTLWRLICEILNTELTAQLRYDIASELGVEEGKIKQIEKDIDEQVKLDRILAQWLVQDPKASPSILVKALKKHGCDELADKVKKLLAGEK
ncbi:Cell adhesion molecule 2 [Branchiostoma belcheri]|nr:Cell adhesion molecule 2 [Branchiostoma belcheri]